MHLCEQSSDVAHVVLAGHCPQNCAAFHIK